METNYRPRDEEYEEWVASNSASEQDGELDEDTFVPHGKGFHLTKEPVRPPSIGLPPGTFVPPNSLG